MYTRHEKTQPAPDDIDLIGSSQITPIDCVVVQNHSLLPFPENNRLFPSHWIGFSVTTDVKKNKTSMSRVITFADVVHLTHQHMRDLVKHSYAGSIAGRPIW